MARIQLLVNNGEIEDKQIEQDELDINLLLRNGYMPKVKISLGSNDMTTSYVCLGFDDTIRLYETLEHLIETGIKHIKENED